MSDDRCSFTDLHPDECAHCRGDDTFVTAGDSRRWQDEAPAVRVWPPRRPETPVYTPMVEPAPTDDPLVKVARDLRAILDMAPLLNDRGEALARDHVMPGGDAVVTAGPTASPSTWERRFELVEADWMRRHAAGLTDDERPAPESDDWEPPLQTLLFWSEDWRHRLGMDYGLTPTLVREASFLANADVLAWAWDHEPHWDNYAEDVKVARTRMENVVRSGIRTTRSRIVCDKSHTDGKAHKRLNVVYGSDDHAAGYIAPCCHARYTPDEAKRAHAKQMRSAGAEKMITTTEAIAALAVQGWQRRTVRRWIEPLRHAADRCRSCRETWPADRYPECPAIRDGLYCGGDLEPVWRGGRDDVPESYCDVKTRRTFVWWPDLWRRHLTARHDRELGA